MIDRLQEESNEGVGTHPTAWVSGFMPLAVPARFEGGILGSKAPTVSPVMTELVCRGVDAIPDLLEHLSDGRPTKITVGSNFMGKWFAAEYDPRDKDHQHPNVDRPFAASFGTEQFSNYTLRVGDLCYVAVGQIVSRNLLAVRYQPTMCLVVNSPVQRPSLAQAVRSDWAGLTREQHRLSLEADQAVGPLLFYYPSTGGRMVDMLLKREVYDDAGIYEFAVDQLIPAGRDEQTRIFQQFARTNGPKYREGLRLALGDLANRQDEFHRNEQLVSKELYARFFGGVAKAEKRNSAIVTYRDQQALVLALSAFDWDGLDPALWGVYLRANSDRPLGLSGRLYRDDLEVECAKRLLHAGHDAAFLADFSKEIEAYKHDDAEALKAQSSLPRGNAGYHFAITQRIAELSTLVRQCSDN